MRDIIPSTDLLSSVRDRVEISSLTKVCETNKQTNKPSLHHVVVVYRELMIFLLELQGLACISQCIWAIHILDKELYWNSGRAEREPTD